MMDEIFESLDSGIIIVSPSSSDLTFYVHIIGSFFSEGCAIISRAVQYPSSLSLAFILFFPRENPILQVCSQWEEQERERAVRGVRRCGLYHPFMVHVHDT